LFRPDSPTVFEVEAQGLPSSRATRLAHVPCSLTPVSRASARCCLRGIQRSRPHDDNLSGLNHTARLLAVYASQSASPHPTQDSLPACFRFGRAGFVPLGRSAGFRVSPSAPPPAPSFLAHWILFTSNRPIRPPDDSQLAIASSSSRSRLRRFARSVARRWVAESRVARARSQQMTSSSSRSGTSFGASGVGPMA